MRTFTEADLQAAIKSASAVIAEARSANPLASNRAVRRAAEREVRRLQRAAYGAVKTVCVSSNRQHTPER
jgi:hypothetical protein